MPTVKVLLVTCDICNDEIGTFVDSAAVSQYTTDFLISYEDPERKWVVCSHKCLRDYLVKTYRDPVPRTPEAQGVYEKSIQDTKERNKLTTQQSREEQWDTALHVDCPTCHQASGAKCINLHLYKKGVDMIKGWPHPERVTKARKFLESQTEPETVGV
jgi:hypothetical protein